MCTLIVWVVLSYIIGYQIKLSHRRLIMEQAKKEIIEFVNERDWNQFHSPSNLAKSISIEAAELLECFQWDNDNFDVEAVCDELADIANYCIQLADKLNVDLEEIVLEKLRKTKQKYPIDKAKGSSKKYNKL